MTDEPKTISNKLFSIEVREDHRFDELNGAHYIPVRDKWIPASISIDLERAKSMRSILNEYIESKEKEKWLDELR